jgi:hypothetical protein
MSRLFAKPIVAEYDLNRAWSDPIIVAAILFQCHGEGSTAMFLLF